MVFFYIDACTWPSYGPGFLSLHRRWRPHKYEQVNDAFLFVIFKLKLQVAFLEKDFRFFSEHNFITVCVHGYCCAQGGCWLLVLMVEILILVVALLVFLIKWWWEQPYSTFDFRLRGELKSHSVWISWAPNQRHCRKCLEDFAEWENQFCAKCLQNGP